MRRIRRTSENRHLLQDSEPGPASEHRKCFPLLPCTLTSFRFSSFHTMVDCLSFHWRKLYSLQSASVSWLKLTSASTTIKSPRTRAVFQEISFNSRWRIFLMVNLGSSSALQDKSISIYWACYVQGNITTILYLIGGSHVTLVTLFSLLYL